MALPKSNPQERKIVLKSKTEKLECQISTSRKDRLVAKDFAQFMLAAAALQVEIQGSRDLQVACLAKLRVLQSTKRHPPLFFGGEVDLGLILIFGELDGA